MANQLNSHKIFALVYSGHTKYFVLNCCYSDAELYIVLPFKKKKNSTIRIASNYKNCLIMYAINCMDVKFLIKPPLHF